MSDSFPSVLVVIINWNGKNDLLLDCLDSIKNIDYPEDRYKVIVIFPHNYLPHLFFYRPYLYGWLVNV